VKDRAHFYVGYERVDRELQQDRVVTVTPANAAALGLQPPPGFIPASQLTNFFIVRPDWKINANQELFGRYTLFTNNSPNNIGGGLNTLERSIDFKDNIQTGNAQLISILSPRLLNEFRFQYSRRNQPSVLNDLSGQGPSITIPGVAQFGAPAATDGPLLFNERITQFLDNVTWNTGAHSLKFGGDVQIVRDRREVALVSTYTFPSISSYLDARNGTNPRNYSQFSQIVGDPKIEFGSQYYFLFAQDDWRVRPNFKLNFGVRYELYDIPDARANAPLAISQKFNRDTNNFAPRLGLSYSFGGTRKTVVRASAGVFYDAPGLLFYQNAIQNNGDPLTRTFTLRPTDAGAPAFPNSVSLTGLTPPKVSIDALAPDFANLYSFNQNLQVEQEISRDFSVTAGYIHVAGNRIPVVRITNLPPISGTLADGRAVFGAGARPNPNFNNINITESVGRSSYHAGSLSLNKRFSRSYQLSASYTWSHGIDDAPEINVIDSTEFPSDPTNRRRDRGNSLADQRHTFIFSGVLNPKFDVSNRIASALANNNQIGVIARFNSGFRQKDALSLSVGVHHTFCSLSFFVVSFVKLPMSIFSCLSFEVKEISAKSVRSPGGVIAESGRLSLSKRREARNVCAYGFDQRQVFVFSYVAKPGVRGFTDRSGSRCLASARLIASKSSSRSNGLRTDAATTLRAASFNDCGESAERKITGGTSGRFSCNSLTTSTPVISGSLKSSRIRSGGGSGVSSDSAETVCIARRPVSTDCTL
jgi:TonB-dependent receptor-like protein